MASEYRTALPDEKQLAAEIERTQAMLRDRQRIAIASGMAGRTRKGTQTERKSAGSKGVVKEKKD